MPCFAASNTLEKRNIFSNPPRTRILQCSFTGFWYSQNESDTINRDSEIGINFQRSWEIQESEWTGMTIIIFRSRAGWSFAIVRLWGTLIAWAEICEISPRRARSQWWKATGWGISDTFQLWLISRVSWDSPVRLSWFTKEPSTTFHTDIIPYLLLFSKLAGMLITHPVDFSATLWKLSFRLPYLENL